MKYLKQYESVKLKSDIEDIFNFELEDNGYFEVIDFSLSLDKLSPSETSVDVEMRLGFSDNSEILSLKDEPGNANIVRRKAAEMLSKTCVKHKARIENLTMPYISWDSNNLIIRFKLIFL